MEMSKVKLLFDNKDVHIKKWEGILGRFTASDKLIELYSIFCEYRTTKTEIAAITSSRTNSYASSSYTNSYGYAPQAPHSPNTPDDLVSELKGIHAKIVALPSIRMKCVDNDLYYNKLHNRFEYLLSAKAYADNQYVGTNKEIPIGGPDLDISDVLSAFPDDFIREVDMIEYRDKKLNSLI